MFNLSPCPALRTVMNWLTHMSATARTTSAGAFFTPGGDNASIAFNEVKSNTSVKHDRSALESEQTNMKFKKEACQAEDYSKHKAWHGERHRTQPLPRLHHNPDRFPNRSLYSVLRSSEMTTTIEIRTCLSMSPAKITQLGMHLTNHETSCCKCPHPHDESPSHDPR